MAGNRTHWVPKLMVGSNDVATKFTAYDAHVADSAKHREINDAGATATDLWSADKITTELADKLESPITPASDIPADSITPAMLQIDNAEVDSYVLSYDLGSGKFKWIAAIASGSDLTDGSVAEAKLDITTAAGVGVDGYALVWDNAGGKLDYAERMLTDMSNCDTEVITEAMMDILDAPADTEVLAWNAGSGKPEWVTHTTGGAASYQVKWDAADTAGYLNAKIPEVPTGWGSGEDGYGLYYDDTAGEMEWLPRLRRLTANTTYYLAHTGNDTTGDGSAGTPWLTLTKVFDYLKDYHIDPGVTVTISMAAGTYTYTSQDVLEHPQLDQIHIIGDGKATTVLEYSTMSTAINIKHGVLGLLQNLTISDAGTVNTGISLAGGGAILKMDAVRITGFSSSGISINIRSNTQNYLALNIYGNVTLDLNGKGIELVGPVAVYIGSSSDISSNTYGIYATGMSIVRTFNCTISNNTNTGIYVLSASTVFAEGATMSGNGANCNIAMTTGDAPQYDNAGSWVYKS